MNFKDLSREGIGMTSSRTRARLTQRMRDAGISNEDVLQAIESVPRHLFVDEALSHRAYEDSPLPIGSNQTISQPYIVAMMTSLVMERAPRRILEIGTGSGYQTAILAALVREVYSVECIGALHQRAKKRFSEMHIHNVSTKHGDGHSGWIERSPFPVILVTAAAEEVPKALLEQLDKEGGRLIIPVGTSFQELRVIDRNGSAYSERVVEKVRFVPLVKGTS